MKRLLLTSCVIGLTATSAVAADVAPRMVTKAPVAAPLPYFTWTGCYIGAHGGWGFGKKDFSDQFFTTSSSVADASSPTAELGGGIAGGQIGCDYQTASNFVFGAEAAASWANIKGTSDPFFDGKAVFNAHTDRLITATGRIGYAFDRVMIYARGGAAWAHDKYWVSGSFDNEPFNFAGSENRFGWTIGAGIAVAFLQNWSANFEYAYYDFGKRSLTLLDTLSFSSEGDPSSVRQRMQTIKVGINYHFWTGGRP